jgi:hypothetical protein
MVLHPLAPFVERVTATLTAGGGKRSSSPSILTFEPRLDELPPLRLPLPSFDQGNGAPDAPGGSPRQPPGHCIPELAVTAIPEDSQDGAGGVEGRTIRTIFDEALERGHEHPGVTNRRQRAPDVTELGVGLPVQRTDRGPCETQDRPALLQALPGLVDGLVEIGARGGFEAFGRGAGLFQEDPPESRPERFVSTEFERH